MVTPVNNRSKIQGGTKSLDTTGSMLIQLHWHVVFSISGMTANTVSRRRWNYRTYGLSVVKQGVSRGFCAALYIMITESKGHCMVTSRHETGVANFLSLKVHGRKQLK